MKILEILTPRKLLGNFGEKSAVKYLRKNRYNILKRNYVSNGHEIDIIAYKDNTIVFIEVKTRTLGHENPKEQRPASSVNKLKQRSIIEASRGYLATSSIDGKKRFDIIEVYVSEGKKRKVDDIRHLINTFNLNTAYPPRTHRDGR